MIYLQLFFLFFKIGLFTIGGGYAMIPLITDEVTSRGYLALNEIIEFIAISESTPGPFAINIATFVGFNQGGVFGALCATLGVVLPCFIIILLIAAVFTKLMNLKIVKNALHGVNSTVVALIGVAFIDVFINCIKRDSNLRFSIINFDYICLIISALIFITSKKFKKMSPLLLIVLSALIGIGFYSIEQVIIT
ncbi:MAG: chromate transporter [Clostridia bacterium]